jgi:hypothetical protein
MEKPVVPRIAGLLVLYLGVFTFLVVLQFSRQRDFTRHVGDMAISGHYGESADDAPDAGLDEFLPEGDLSIVFGGVEFRITGPGGDFVFLRSGGGREYPAVLALAIKEDSAVIRFAQTDDPQAPEASGPLELVFSSRNSAGRPELRITGSFEEGYAGVEIPFRPLRNARVQNMENGNLIVTAEGHNFSFAGSQLNAARRAVVMDTAAPVAVYRAIAGEKGFVLADYTLESARTAEQYADQVFRWRDQVFTAWNRTPTSSLDNEELITAYVADSIHRGSYREVAARIPRSFLDSARRTYISSPFFGRMAQSLRSLSAAEQERASRSAERLAGGPGEFLSEPHAFAENLIRGNTAFIDQGLALLSRLEAPALDLAPLILEACVDLAEYQAIAPVPESLVETFLLLIAESLRKDEAEGRVLVFTENAGEAAADAEFNLRLGTALDQYGRLAGREDWAAVGRSLVLSVLAYTDTVGMIPSAFTLGAEGGFTPGRESRFSAARLYRYLRIDNYPRARRIAGGVNGWAWTTVSAIDVTQNGNITDIAVSFPVGETHYMILRGLKPFTKIQLYGIDYRTDPQFERYDSSGWSYSSSEQSLLLKVTHQNPVEHIVIYTAPPPPSPPPRPPEPAPENAVAGAAPEASN